MRRGEVWTATRTGRERLVVLVGHDTLTTERAAVLVVPLSDVRSATLIEPSVRLDTGEVVGIAMTPRVGEVNKDYLTERRGQLALGSMEALNIALRAVFDL